MSPDRLSAEQMERYQAHLQLPGFNVASQRRLTAARALVIGVGGLGCPIAQYLVAAGVGTVGLADDDIVDVTNLQRQVLFDDSDRGRGKVEVAALRLRAQNPSVQIREHAVRVTAANVLELVREYDLVLDGSDNFATRYVVNDACVLAAVPLVTGSLYRFEGQVTVIAPPITPCYRCVFRSAPSEQPPCHDAGLLGALAGIVGSIQAAEGLKLLGYQVTALMGRLLLVDTQQMSFRTVQLRRDPECPLCGQAPSIDRPTAVAVCEPASR